jgi:glycosyltransferase involved in cell wall biosynthesis
VRDYAKAIVDLIDDADDRARMSKFGRVRVEKELAWPHSARAYLGVYQRVTGSAADEPVQTGPAMTGKA